jgi:Tfp pilus assembly protein PilN
MMEIRYNIASGKKIRYPRFILISVVLLLFSLGFAAVGVMNLSTTSKRFRDKKEVLKNYEEKVRDKRQQNETNKAQIEQIRKQWRKEIKFANDLIRDKTYPFLKKLDKLEKLLPAGVYINKIAMETDDGSNLRFGIVALSSAKLTEAYNTFIPFNLSIPKENPVGGVYKAELRIKLD